MLAKRPAAGRERRGGRRFPRLGDARVVLGGRLGYVLFYKPGNISRIRSRRSRSGTAACRSMAAPSASLRPSCCSADNASSPPCRSATSSSVPFRSACSRAPRQFHQFRAVGPRQRRAVGDGLPQWRSGAAHPSQLYEAGWKASRSSFILNGIERCTANPHPPGALSGVFLIGYGVARSIAELSASRTPSSASSPSALHGPVAVAAARRRRPRPAAAPATSDSGDVTPLESCWRGASARKARSPSRVSWPRRSAIRNTATTRRAIRSAGPAISPPRPRSARSSAS